MTAVYNHFERIMMTLERNLRNEKTGNEKIIKQTYIIRKHKETNTNGNKQNICLIYLKEFTGITILN